MVGFSFSCSYWLFWVWLKLLVRILRGGRVQKQKASSPGFRCSKIVPNFVEETNASLQRWIYKIIPNTTSCFMALFFFLSELRAPSQHFNKMISGTVPGVSHFNKMATLTRMVIATKMAKSIRMAKSLQINMDQRRCHGRVAAKSRKTKTGNFAISSPLLRCYGVVIQHL